jgi:Ca2+-binding EF-hand superfamily protein
LVVARVVNHPRRARRWWCREFQIALGYRGKTSRFVDRIFALFDGNHDGRITFTEFVHGLAKLSPNAVLKDKLKCALAPASPCVLLVRARGRVRVGACARVGARVVVRARARTLTVRGCVWVCCAVSVSFDIYNVSGDGFISREELSAMIQGALEENDVSLSAGEVGAIVDATFREVDTNSDGVIDFAEYSAMVQKQPSILKPLTLNVSELINTSRSPVGEASGK